MKSKSLRTSLRTAATACCIGLLSLTLVGCTTRTVGISTTTEKVAGKRGATQMREIAALCKTATSRHRRPHRMPIRTKRDRAFRQLAERSDRLADKTVAWGGAEFDGFRDSLRNLSASARSRNAAAVRKSYSAAAAAYSRLPN